MRRHDNYKGSYQRERKAKGIGDHDLRKLFCGICLLIQSESFDRQELCRIAEKSAKVSQIEGSTVDDVVDDIVEISNLILEEGGEYSFLHKSIREFHGAEFVALQADKRARRFYESLQLHWRRRAEELRFLSTIDKYRFTKWFLIPHLHIGLGAFADPSVELTVGMTEVKTFLEDSMGTAGCAPFHLIVKLGASETHYASSSLLDEERIKVQLESGEIDEGEGRFDALMRQCFEQWKELEEPVRVAFSRMRMALAEASQYVRDSDCEDDVFGELIEVE